MCYNEEEQGKEWQMGDTKIQWHPGFVAAMSLEFEDNRDNLIFEKEYTLLPRMLCSTYSAIPDACHKSSGYFSLLSIP